MVILLVSVYVFLLLLFNLLDFRMQIVPLFEELRFVFQSLIQKLSEAVEIVDAVH